MRKFECSRVLVLSGLRICLKIKDNVDKELPSTYERDFFLLRGVTNYRRM